MSMTKSQIAEAIRDRLIQRWPKRCRDEDASPYCLIAIKQIPGANYGTPVLCTMEDVETEQLADLLEGVARELRRMRPEYGRDAGLTGDGGPKEIDA